jgi:hypothetical protein
MKIRSIIFTVNIFQLLIPFSQEIIMAMLTKRVQDVMLERQTVGTIVRDRFGTMYVVGSRTGDRRIANVPTSITFALSNDPANIGVEINPKLWSYKKIHYLQQLGVLLQPFPEVKWPRHSFLIPSYLLIQTPY